MAITKTIIANSSTRTVVKVTATAASDTAMIVIAATATPSATGSVTFSASAKTIVRTTGSWITDYTAGTSVPVAGNLVKITITNGANNLNKVLMATITNATTLTLVTGYTIADETLAGGLTFTGSWSDLAYSQEGVPSIPSAGNITKCKYSCTATGDVTTVRNSITVLKLFGNGVFDEMGLAEANTYPIVTTFNTGAGGTVIYEIAKAI